MRRFHLNADHLMIQVVDSGMGMDRAQFEQYFMSLLKNPEHDE